jgi:hypothetical protein
MVMVSESNCCGVEELSTGMGWLHGADEGDVTGVSERETVTERGREEKEEKLREMKKR